MEKINVAGLLKDCPKGMELDCSMYNNVTFERIVDWSCYPIQIKTPEGNMQLSKYGCMSLVAHAKCVIFPKGETTWEGFRRPFRDGDIICNRGIKAVAIFNKQTDDITISHCYLNRWGKLIICHHHCRNLSDWRFATEEEKERLFKAIRDNGYKWNAETRTLEKLVPNKFDITTLIRFESRVLARNYEGDRWLPLVWGFYNDDDTEWPYNCSGFFYGQCIPYEGNEHLLGKTDDCDEFYKTWEP